MLTVSLGGQALPSPVLAHVAGIEYEFPLPVWLFALAGALAVVASVPAAAVAVKGERARTSRNLYPAIRDLHLGAFGLLITTLLLVAALLAGLFNDQGGFFNAAVVLFWVDLWVGIGISSALVGNAWDFVSPLNAAGRVLERVLARRGVPVREFPRWLGVWPSVLLLLAFSWVELVWDESREPTVIATMIIAYFLAQLLAMAVFGTETWLARGELLTAVARTFARVAPIELAVSKPANECRAGRCENDGERIGCPTCWLDAPEAQRILRLRPYGAGILREPSFGPGGAAFVVTMLGTVVYDGLRGTTVYWDVAEALAGALQLKEASDTLSTVMMLLVVGLFALVFVTAVAFVGRLEGSTLTVAAGRYAPSLIPIAAAYFIAHYLLYLFYVGQLTPGLALDPFGKHWVGDYQPWTNVPGSIVWAIQAGVIVVGHILAVIAAHRISLSLNRSAGGAIRSQAPLVALMVIYTFSGLLVLGLALQGDG